MGPKGLAVSPSVLSGSSSVPQSALGAVSGALDMRSRSQVGIGVEPTKTAIHCDLDTNLRPQ